MPCNIALVFQTKKYMFGQESPSGNSGVAVGWEGFVLVFWLPVLASAQSVLCQVNCMTGYCYQKRLTASQRYSVR